MMGFERGTGREGMTRVLVVEDDAQTAAEIAAALGDHGFEVECAHTGRDALARAVADRYSAIVLDRMLPGGVDGLAVLSSLRGLGVDTPVLILSALSAVRMRTGVRRLSDETVRVAQADRADRSAAQAPHQPGTRD